MTRRLTDPDFLDEIRRLKERLAVLERTALATGRGFPNFTPEGPSFYVDEVGKILYLFDGSNWRQIVFTEDPVTE